MRSSYDVVVIGSGYGGAVAASRLARCQDANGKRQSVCVLERGKEKWPGEYPTGVLDAFDELHVSGEFAPGWLPSTTVEKGDPTGMYHLIFGKGLNAVVGNGNYMFSCYVENHLLTDDRPGWHEFDERQRLSRSQRGHLVYAYLAQVHQGEPQMSGEV